MSENSLDQYPNSKKSYTEVIFSYPSRVDCLKHMSWRHSIEFEFGPTGWIEQVRYDPEVIWTGASRDSIEQGRQISHRSYNNILSTDGSKEMIMRAEICWMIRSKKAKLRREISPKSQKQMRWDNAGVDKGNWLGRRIDVKILKSPVCHNPNGCIDVEHEEKKKNWAVQYKAFRPHSSVE